MIRQYIAKTLLITYIASVVISGKDDTEESIAEAERYYMLTKDYCSMDELGEMDYYLFCDTQINKGAGGCKGKPSIINNDTKTIEEAKELYQGFREELPLEEKEESNGKNDSNEDERIEVFYVSPDCKWIVTMRSSEHGTICTQKLFNEKEIVREKTSETRRGVQPILIVKDGDSYREMEEEQYRKLTERVWLNFFEAGHGDLNYINPEGNLFVEISNDFSSLTINSVEDGAERWSYDLEGIHEKVEKIRNDVEEEEWVLVKICQFEGNEQEGWLVVQAGPSSFFRVAYPSDEVTYLGEYLYSLRFSPDGKYAAYTSVDYDNGVGMDPVEEQQVPPPGIYIMEMETGKTAYIYWDPLRNPEESFMEYRDFLWLEKESFEEYMTDTGN
ncbi:hypothetical protein D7V83_14015 [bacterium 0.1xD8-71]|nr:hypothetical protein D7V83_14015 [bacterium 0.1xD8-71]